MKTLCLLFVFVLFISCTKSTKQKSNYQLKETKIDSILIVKEKLVEHNLQTDTLSLTVKEKKVPITLDTLVTEQKNTLVVSKKDIIEEKKSKIIEQKKVIVEEIIKKKQIVTKPNHESWDKLTNTYVSSNGKVNYTGFKSKISTINNYLIQLQNTPPTKSWSKNEKLAYWFNLYNASTVHLVTSNYPVKSIKDINGGKPWDKKFIKSGTNLYSLNDIENTLVRPNFNEPRLHVAFNCAAVSCPNLLNEAFSPIKLNSQLNSLSKQWLNDSSKNKITKDKIEISQIFDWYKMDFKKGIVSFLNTHSSNIKVDTNPEVSYMTYDWKLND